MDRPGAKLRHARERLGLTYRDVVEASQKIAQRRSSEEFAVALSRLADIENKGTLPTVYRLYTLCAIYRLDWKEVLRWYGVPVDLLSSDAVHIGHRETHALHFSADQMPALPPAIDREIDLNRTTFLNHLVGRWGKIPLSFVAGLEQRHLHYGIVGLSDWSMYPILHPGSLMLIDQIRRQIAVDGWTSEMTGPIYFLEHPRRLPGVAGAAELPVVYYLSRIPRRSSRRAFRIFRDRYNRAGNRRRYAPGIEKASPCSYFNNSSKVSKSVR